MVIPRNQFVLLCLPLLGCADVLGISTVTLETEPESTDSIILLASDEASPTAMIVSGDRVYWGTNTGEIRSIAKDGSEDTPVTFASTSSSVSVARMSTHDNWIYWIHSSSKSIFRAQASDSTSQVLEISFSDLDGNIVGLDVYKDNIYFTAADSVYSYPVDGGDLDQIASEQDGAAGIVANGYGVYWENTGTVTEDNISVGSGNIMGATFDDGTLKDPTEIKADSSIDGTPTYICLYEDHLYFSTYKFTDNLGGKVMQIEIDGSDLSTLSSNEGQPLTVGCAQDGVYWLADADPEASTSDGSVLGYEAGSHVSPAQDQQFHSFLNGIALDESYLYWTTLDGNILRAPRDTSAE